MTRRLPAVAATCAACVILAASASPVAADTETRLQRGMAWGGLTLEASMAGVFAVNFGTRWVPNHGPGLLFNFTPMVLAPGVGWLMRNVDADPAYTLHGAAWAGFDLFLLGALIDGRHDRDRLRVGPTALTLGAIGAVAGGIFGATRIGTTDDAQLGWMVGPPAGFVAGGIGLGTLLVLIGGLDGDKAISQWSTGAALGLAVGAGVGTYLVLREPDSPAARVGATPTVDPAAHRYMLSFGGRF